jgi:hypothetical protein
MYYAGACFGTGSELGFEPSAKTVGTAGTSKLVPPNTNAEGSAVKGSEDEDSEEQAYSYRVNASEDEDKELNG